MHLHGRVTPFVSFLLALCNLTLSAPTQSTSSSIHNAGTDLTNINLPQAFNNSIGPATAQGLNTNLLPPVPVSPSRKGSNDVGDRVLTWDINQTLSLVIDIYHWVLTQDRIFATLEAAQTAVGKKQAGALLDEEFTQKTGSWINTMIFEIEPANNDHKILTWGDVAQVLSDEDGLPRFFKASREWHCIDFGFYDSERGGIVGKGSLRKWYMLESGAVSGE